MLLDEVVRLLAPETVPLTSYTLAGCSDLDEGARMYWSYFAAAAALATKTAAPSVCRRGAMLKCRLCDRFRLVKERRVYLYVLMALQLSVSASRVARIGHEDSPGHLLRASRRSSSHLLFRKAIDEMMSRSCLCCHRTCGEDVGYAARVSLLVAVPLNVQLSRVKDVFIPTATHPCIGHGSPCCFRIIVRVSYGAEKSSLTVAHLCNYV